MSDSIYVSKEVCASISAANPSYCSFCTAAGQVMICYKNSNEWTLQGSGYIDLSIDQNQNLFINLYSTENYQITYQFQLYPNFSKHYQKLSETFYKFETNDNYIVGLSFSSLEEAKNFENAIINQSKRVKKRLFTKSPKDSGKSPRNSTIITSGIESPLQNSLEARGFSKDDLSSGKIDKATLLEIISEADNHLDQNSTPPPNKRYRTPQKKNSISDKIDFNNCFDVDNNNNIVSGEFSLNKRSNNVNNNNDNNDNDDNNNNSNEIENNNDSLINSNINNDQSKTDQAQEQIKLNQNDSDFSSANNFDGNINIMIKSDGNVSKSPNNIAAKNYRAQRGRANSTVILRDGQFFINEFQVKPPPKVKPPPPDTPPPLTARRIPKIDTLKNKRGQTNPLLVKQSPLAIEKNDDDNKS